MIPACTHNLCFLIGAPFLSNFLKQSKKINNTLNIKAAISIPTNEVMNFTLASRNPHSNYNNNTFPPKKQISKPISPDIRFANRRRKKRTNNVHYC